MKKIFTKDNASTALKGFCIGALMTFPGMSGGTLALIADIYDRLVAAVSGLRKNFKKNFLFLLLFGLCGAAGMLLFSKVLLYLAQTYPLPMRFLFVGLIIGGVPMLLRKMFPEKQKLATYKYVITGLLFLAGIGAVLLINMMPDGLVSFDTGFSLKTVWGVVVAAFFLAVAMILPGISFSHMLIVLGIYDRFYKALGALPDVRHWGENSGDILFLFVIGVATVIGVLALIKVLDKCMTQYPMFTFSAILGFVFASIRNVLQGDGLPIPPYGAGTVIISVVFLIAGATAVFFITRKSKAKQTEQDQ